MEDLQTIKITNQEGKEIEIKAITILKKPNDGKSFLLYTFDSESDSMDVYASILKEENDTYVLDSITDKEDWDLIQKAIEELTR